MRSTTLTCGPGCGAFKRAVGAGFVSAGEAGAPAAEVGCLFPFWTEGFCGGGDGMLVGAVPIGGIIGTNPVAIPTQGVGARLGVLIAMSFASTTGDTGGFGFMLGWMLPRWSWGYPVLPYKWVFAVLAGGPAEWSVRGSMRRGLNRGSRTWHHGIDLGSGTMTGGALAYFEKGGGAATALAATASRGQMLGLFKEPGGRSRNSYTLFMMYFV